MPELMRHDSQELRRAVAWQLHWIYCKMTGNGLTGLTEDQLRQGLDDAAVALRRLRDEWDMMTSSQTSVEVFQSMPELMKIQDAAKRYIKRLDSWNELAIERLRDGNTYRLANYRRSFCLPPRDLDLEGD